MTETDDREVAKTANSSPTLRPKWTDAVGPRVTAFQRKKSAAIGAKAPFLDFIEPALATSIEKIPSGYRWFQEIKLAGYRVQVHLANEAVNRRDC